MPTLDQAIDAAVGLDDEDLYKRIGLVVSQLQTNPTGTLGTVEPVDSFVQERLTDESLADLLPIGKAFVGKVSAQARELLCGEGDRYKDEREATWNAAGEGASAAGKALAGFLVLTGVGVPAGILVFVCSLFAKMLVGAGKTHSATLGRRPPDTVAGNRVERIIDVDREGSRLVVHVDSDRLRDRSRRMQVSPVVPTRVRKALAAGGSNEALPRVHDDANDLFPIGWLRVGLHFARSVGRIEGVKPGTGTIVSPRLLLTNHHVLMNHDIAAQATLVMNDELADASRRLAGVRYPLRPRSTLPYRGGPGLHFRGGVSGGRASLRVSPTDSEAWKGYGRRPRHHYKHPGAGPKEIAFRQNRVTKILDPMIEYQTDTLGGSSGSPVLNYQWDLVALHHDAVAKTDAHGRWVDVDGRPSGLDAERTHWIANERTRVSSILAAVRQADVDAATGGGYAARRAYIEEIKHPSKARRSPG